MTKNLALKQQEAHTTRGEGFPIRKTVKTTKKSPSLTKYTTKGEQDGQTIDRETGRGTPQLLGIRNQTNATGRGADRNQEKQQQTFTLEGKRRGRRALEKETHPVIVGMKYAVATVALVVAIWLLLTAATRLAGGVPDHGIALVLGFALVVLTPLIVLPNTKK